MPKKEMPPAAWASSQEGQAENSESLDGFAPSIPRPVDSINTRTTRAGANAQRLLDALHAGGAGHAYLWLKSATGEDKRTIWYRPGAPLPTLPAGQWDAYFSVNLATVKRKHNQRAKIEHVGQIAALYADMDNWRDLDDLYSHFEAVGAPLPSAAVASGGGYHCYWLLSAPLAVTDENRALVCAVQKAWVEHVGGCPGAKCITRVLRLPDTVNHKPERNGATVELAALDAERRYDFDELHALVSARMAADAPAERTGAPQMPRPAITVDDATLIEKMLRSPRIDALWRGDASGYAGDHSAADMALCLHLAWWTNRDAERMDRLFRQSGLYRPKWDRQDYRERTINKAIERCSGGYDPAYHAPTEQDRVDLAGSLQAAWHFALRGGLAHTIRAAGYRRALAPQATYAALLTMAERFGRLTFTPGMDGLAAATGYSVGTIHNHLAMLEAAGLIVLPTERKKGKAVRVELIVSNLKTNLHAPCVNESFQVRYDYQFYRDHLGDDAFARPYWQHTERRRAAGLAVEDAYGESGRLVLDYLAAHPTGTRQAMAAATGASVSSIGAATRKLERDGLIVVAGLTGRNGRAKVYALAGTLTEVEDRLDALRPTLKTHGIAQVRRYKAEANRAAWIDKRLKRPSWQDEANRAKLEARRDKADQMAVALLTGLLAMGIDPRKPVRRENADGMPHTPRQRILKIDPAAEWERRWLPLWTRWQELDSLPDSQRAYILEAEGHTDDDLHRLLNYWVPKMIRRQVDYFSPQPAYQPDMLAAD